MTEKRFKLRLSKLGNGMITDIQKREDLYFDKEFLDATLPTVTEWLNELAEDNEQLKETIETQNFNYDNAKSIIHDSENQIRNLKDKNEQLKKQSTHFESEMYVYKGSEEYYKQLLIEKDEEILHLKNALNKIKEIINEE